MRPPLKAIAIRVSNQQGYIWDVEDIRTLRVQHNICGVFTGTLPQIGQQNVFLGLPLMLLPEEVVLLVKNNLAFLVDDLSAHKSPSREQTVNYNAARSTSIEQQRKQSAIFEEQKRKAYFMKSSHSTTDDSAVEISAVTKAAKTPEQVNLASFEVSVPKTKILESVHGQKTRQRDETDSMASITYTIVIEPSSDRAPWYDPLNSSYETLESARVAGIWNYPSNSLQTTRCHVFEDLWKKGNFMGVGLRFGGDFLVYPGDPLRYHSHFSLTVLESPSSPIMPLDIVSYGRLATGVKKAHLLASWSDELQTAYYYSLEWAAMG